MIWTYLALIATFALAPSQVSAQEATPPRPIAAPAGIDDAVARSFVLSGSSAAKLGRTSYLAFAVVDYDPQFSDEDLVPSLGRIGELFGEYAAQEFALSEVDGGFDLSPGMEETAAPPLGDWSAASIGVSDDGRISMAVLEVGVGDAIYLMVGGGIDADPLADVIAVAEGLFGGARARTSDSTPDYRTTGLWRELPRLEDLPPGFVFMGEWPLIATPRATPTP